MKAVVYAAVGGPEVVEIREVPRPAPAGDQLLVRVRAAGLNRGDLLQRAGDYRVPAGQSTIPGVEVAGTVEAWGDGVSGFGRGDRVFGVVEGGGLAEYCLLDRGMAIPIPPAWGFREAAAAAESGLTADETLYTLGGLARRQRVLVHAAASSIGTTMIQMARHTGAVVYATVGTASKVAPLRALGADAVIEHRREDFAAAVEQLTGGEGVDLVMDFVGGAFLARNLAVLRRGGCLVVVGLFDGCDASIDLLAVVERRLQLKGSSLRLRPMIEKREVNRRFRERWMVVIERGELRPVLHAVYPLAEIRAAQAEMEANRNVGKIVLELE